MKQLLLFLLILLLASCGPSEAQIQEAIQKTQAVVSQTETAEADFIIEIQTVEAKAQIVMAATEEAVASATQTADAYVIAYCGLEQVNAKYTEMNDIAKLFSDDMELARSTSRIALSPVIGKMQEKAQRVERLEVPTCQKKSRDYLAGGMYSTIDAFLAFMSEDIDLMNTHLSEAARKMDLYADEMRRILTCAPDCDL